ncbi:hypothetical protein ABW19_dt0205550 [Dactylella cylindrospora]|nr:hypothetical protein ABW19_dt0205550 [Dactylella cylindrospora]
MAQSKPRSNGLFFSFFALLLATTISFLILFVYFHPVYIAQVGDVSASTRTGYVAGVTLCANIATIIINAACQDLLAKKFDIKLEKWRLDYWLLPLKPLDRDWRAIINVDQFFSKFRRLGIHSRYWIIGLITAALSASLTLTTTTREFPYSQEIRDGTSTQLVGSGDCAGVFNLPLQDPTWPYYWDIGNNQVFLVQTKQGGCPTRDAQMVLGNINTFDSSLFAYMDAGVAVHRSVIGAPRTIYSPETFIAPDLNRVLDEYRSSVVSTRQCVRVMARNPISCRPGGTIIWTKPWLNVSSDDGLCNSWRQFTSDGWDHYNNAGGGVMQKTMCAHDEIGRGTIVVGAEGGYAHWLAVSVGDTEGAPPTAAGEVYVVTCTVDTRDVFEYREVSLLLRNKDTSQTRYMRFLNSTGNSCSGPPIIRDVIATAASANWQTLLQQAGADGWWDLVWQASGNGRSAPYAFEQSTNALEDVLGLVTAMVTARMNSTTTRTINSTAVVQATRIGDGEVSSVAFAIPSLLAVVILLILIFELLGTRLPEADCTKLDCLVNIKNTPA